MTIRTSWDRSDVQTGGDVVLTTRTRWLRAAAYYGQPPGSHIGLWRTRTTTVHGWNLRIGRRYAGPCLTFIAHTRTNRQEREGRG